ncbi:hypothetical protein [Bdellovibrio sp. HCB288]|uniref:hypothetical protein n=1 Tax=Bdellovibrio sp. HCB288 TaxID=3394355 RepID=UPI0039B6D20B
MFLRRTFAVLVSLATLLTAMPSVAQSRNMRPPEQDLQRRVYQLESTVYQLSQRLERLEYGAPESRGWVCIVKDPTWGKVYQGKAESRVEASAQATNACVTGSGFAMNCRAEPTCERL